MPGKVLQEGENFPGIDISLGMKAEKELDTLTSRRNDQGGDNGNFPKVVRPLPEARCLTAGSPSSPHKWNHQEPAFIEKNKGGAYARGVFFTRGQSALIQDRMASSSRSTARRCGFWGLQPRECKTRPIWST